MVKSYFDGKVKLKEPTFKGMLKVGKLLDENEFTELIAGDAVPELMKTICTVEEGFDISKIPAINVVQIAVDYLSGFVKEGEKELPPLKLSLEDMEPFTFLTKTADKIRERNMKKYA